MTSDARLPIILLVEDDPLLSTTMRRYLERWSGDVRLAETCAQAVAAWRAMPAGVVMMDYRLPDGFGTDVIARLRRDGRTDPVVCMTGEAESIPPELQKALDIRRVLGKPVMLDVLRPELDALGGAARSARSTGRGRMVHPCGKYRHVQWFGPLTGRRVERLCKAAKSETWVALDVTRVRDAEPEAWRRLCAWAGWLSGSGGRLCLIVQEPERRQQVAREVGDYMDVLGSTRMLEIQSTRLTGAAERRQLMNLITVPARTEPADG